MGNSDALAGHRTRFCIEASAFVCGAVIRSLGGLQRRLDVTPHHFEFDLRWLADIRYALGRWPAAVHREIRFG
jgi:hypothetical protein